MHDQVGGSEARRRSFATMLTAGLLLCTLVFLTFFVLSRHGNLAWDDADYLRRGLSDARYSVSESWLVVIPRLLNRLIHEQPKPPFLVGWIALGSFVTGRSQVDLLMVCATVVPFLLLALGTVILARRYGGAEGGLCALVLLLASPRSLEFGGKVMVETFLGLWVVLVLALASELCQSPGRRQGIALGFTAGLALLTKLTAFLLLAGGVVLFLWWTLRPAADGSMRKRALGWAVVACLAVAGPWYACNGRRALEFGAFSARYNLLAERQSRIVPAWERLTGILGDLPGWPVLVTLGVIGFGGVVPSFRPLGGVAPPDASRTGAEWIPARFRVLVVVCTTVAAIALTFPPYFDTRFLLPLWPSIAVALGSVLSERFRGLSLAPRSAVAAAVTAGLAASGLGVVNQPASTTCWAARGLIDRIVQDYSVATLANVGDTADWNVCKTGLINELRENPGDCFVLHDLSAESDHGLRARLPRFDAVVILEPEAFPPGFLEASPGLNRACHLVTQTVQSDAAWERVEGLPREELPPLSVYVRARLRAASRME